MNIISADKNDTPQKIIDKIRTEINAVYNNSEYNIVVEKFDEIDGKIDNVDEVKELSVPYIAYKNQAGYGESTDNIYYFGIKHKNDPSQFGWSFVSVVEEQIDIPDLPDAIEPVKNLFGSAGKIRIKGDNRYETSMKAADGIKKSLAEDKFNTIIVACGDDYADALSGSYLAKKKNAPILLVDYAYEAAIKDYIYTNVKTGGTVYLLGGTGAVSQEFEKSLHDYNVKRLGGADRYETNLKILDEAGIEGDKILLCSAWSFADSLSASATGNPILLVGNSLNKKQAALLKSFEPKKYYIIGGEGAVNYDVEKTLRKYGKVERVSGLNRYETSVAVANEFFDYGADAGVLAYGENFPDGLSAGPLALSISAPLILVSDSDIACAAKYFGNMGIKRAAALGGESLISDSSIDSILY